MVDSWGYELATTDIVKKKSNMAHQYQVHKATEEWANEEQFGKNQS